MVICKALHNWDINIVTFGHGGIIAGPNCKERLIDAYSWVLRLPPGWNTWMQWKYLLAYATSFPILSFIKAALFPVENKARGS